MNSNQMQYPATSGGSSGGGNGKRNVVLGIVIALVALFVIAGSLVAGSVGAFFILRGFTSSESGSELSAVPAASAAPEASDPGEPQSEPEQIPASNTKSKLTISDSSEGRAEKSYAEVYAENVSSTVGITTSVTTNYFGFKTTSAASGSGFFLTEDGYVLTNYHVIEGATSIKVTAYDDTSYTAELIGYSEANDVAVLKVEASGVRPVTIGHSSDMVVGDLVAAIGNPLGELTFSLTSGVVSALNRSITTSSGTTMSLIQTDCAINSGNSGGALFNMYGEVIGITNAKYAGSVNGSSSIDNIGFAIPVDSVVALIRQIIEDGYVLQPYIGVSTQSVSNAAVRYGYPQGAYVEMVARDGAADQAGVKQGDIITAVDGNAITGKASLTEAIAACEIGSTVKLTVFRDGGYLELSVVIGQRKQTVTGGGSSSSYT